MNHRLNNILVAVIAVILGLLLLFGSRLPMRAGSWIALAAGLALVALALSKGKRWPLLPGVCLVFAGGSQMLGRFLPFETGWLLGAACFMIPGVVCYLRYRATERTWLLRAASFLLWIGLFVMVRPWGFLWVRGFALFCLFMAAACFTVTIVSRKKDRTYRAGWFWLIPAILMVTHSTVRLLAAGALVAGGAVLIARNARGRRHGAGEAPTEEVHQENGGWGND